MKLAVLLKLILGFLALLMAAIGLLLPIWPTTPFVLLAAFCFSATPAIKSRILNIKIFGEYYESYTSGKGLCRKTVVRSLIFLWVMLVLSMVLMSKLWLTLLLIIVGSAVTTHILWISRGTKKV